MAGRLEGAVGDRPISLLASDRDVTLVVNQFSTLFTSRRGWRTVAPPLRVILAATRLRLVVRLKWFGDLEAWPNPGFLVRMLLPPTWQLR